MKPIIKIKELGKQYRLGSGGDAGYGTLRESLSGLVRAPFNLLRGRGRSRKATMWALKNINLEIYPGEVVGIIGCNGSGKSTLLKIISRVTEPTEGRIELYGRVGSLLEVGTGFHPELTGRENVYLNGAILGMKKEEIERKFNEIVAFAEVEKFLDTPVKRYSSGMYVRLAFAVAAHLEPDVLLVDEVLSVGDMAYQRKCLEKIGQMRTKGNAIVIVSHNMIAMRAICGRVVLLSGGELVASGTPDEVIPLYEKLMLENALPSSVTDEQEEGMGQIQIKSVRLVDADGSERQAFETGESLRVVIEYVATQRVENVVAYAGIRRMDDFICTGTSTKLENVRVPELYGPGVIELEIPELLVIPGYYVMDVTFYDKNFEFRTYFLGRKRISFKIESTLPALDDKYGVFYQRQNWNVENVNQD